MPSLWPEGVVIRMIDSLARRLGTQGVYAVTVGQIQLRGEESSEPGRGALADFVPKIPDGCRHSPSCFTCPLPECRWSSTEGKPTFDPREISDDDRPVYVDADNLPPGTALVRTLAEKYGITTGRIHQWKNRGLIEEVGRVKKVIGQKAYVFTVYRESDVAYWSANARRPGHSRRREK